MTLTVGSLFSGIGGIDLGLERCGMTVKWQSEIEPYSCQVLKKHWPHVPNLGNIREVNWKEVEKVDVIAGGYPCQPFSTAGKRGGSDDPRHLWPEMLRAISVLRPRVAFLENVRGHYSLGFDRVLGDLADIGYDCQWEIVSAQSVGAPHRRERLICLAYPKKFPSNGRECGHSAGTVREWSALQDSARGSSSDVANTDDTRGGTSRTDADRNGSEDVTGWYDQSQSQLGRCGEDVADPNGIGQSLQIDGEQSSVKQFAGNGSKRRIDNDVAYTTKQSSDGEPDHSRDSKQPETIPELGDSSRAAYVADTDGDNTTYGRQCESLQGKDRGRGDDGSGSGSDTWQIGMGSTRQDSSNVANTNPRQTGGRVGSQPADRRHLSRRADHLGRKEGYAGGQWWATEPDVGRVAHGVPARVDRLRGLGNAVVPQVAEVVGRVIVEMLTPG